jgi:hypothetical protein
VRKWMTCFSDSDQGYLERTGPMFSRVGRQYMQAITEPVSGHEDEQRFGASAGALCRPLVL